MPLLQGFGLVVLMVAIVVSVQIGRGRVWPGTRLDRTAPRVVLLLLNVFALVVALPVIDEIEHSIGPSAVAAAYDASADPGVQGPGMIVDGSFVENVYPYDATGHPLTGVQLYDQNGRPLEVTRDPGYDQSTDLFVVRYPWQNGNTSSWNTYPLPERTQDLPDRSGTPFEDLNPPAITPPLAAVSPVSLPGVEAPATQAVPDPGKKQAPKTARKHQSGSPTG